MTSPSLLETFTVYRCKGDSPALQKNCDKYEPAEQFVEYDDTDSKLKLIPKDRRPKLNVCRYNTMGACYYGRDPFFEPFEEEGYYRGTTKYRTDFGDLDVILEGMEVCGQLVKRRDDETLEVLYYIRMDDGRMVEVNCRSLRKIKG